MNTIKNFLAGLGVAGFFAFWLFMFFAGGIALHYDVMFWTHYFHHTMHGDGALFWLVCLVGGLFVGGLSIPVAIFTVIFSFFV